MQAASDYRAEKGVGKEMLTPNPHPNPKSQQAVLTFHSQVQAPKKGSNTVFI